LQTELTDGIFPKFSPEGERILFQRGVEAGAQSVWIINTDGSSETEVVHNPEFCGVTPSWSPDGERVVYAAGIKRETELAIEDLIEELELYEPIDIRVINVDGTADTQITGDRGPDGFPIWSNDGFIYFCSLRQAQDEYDINIFRLSFEVTP
jgi:Tol biopolymer transport system component